ATFCGCGCGGGVVTGGTGAVGEATVGGPPTAMVGVVTVGEAGDAPGSVGSSPGFGCGTVGASAPGSETMAPSLRRRNNPPGWLGGMRQWAFLGGDGGVLHARL